METHSREIRFVDELEEFIKNLSPSQIYTYSGVDSDSGLPTIEINGKYLQSSQTNT